MHRPIPDIERDIQAAREEETAASLKRRRLDDELKEARLADAEANPHPWLGKKITRKVPHSYRRDDLVSQHGTLKVLKKREYFRGCSARTGELVVVSASGKSAHRFDGLKDHPWELA
jgi:hypothetical protein